MANGNDIYAQLQAIIDEVKDQMNKKVMSVGQKVANEITDQANTSIQNFYAWNPKQYGRTDKMLNVPKRYYVNHGGGRVQAGVNFNLPSSGYPSIFYQRTGKVMSPDAMFDIVWEQGRHGMTEKFPWASHIHSFPPVQQPAPLDEVIKKRDEIFDNIENYF